MTIFLFSPFNLELLFETLLLNTMIKHLSKFALDDLRISCCFMLILTFLKIRALLGLSFS